MKTFGLQLTARPGDKLGRRPIPWAVALVAMSLALAAISCGGESDDGPVGAISPIEPILEGEIRVEDITSSAAVLRVSTSIPVVCSVVYGQDDSYGQISTDLDMAGSAHSTHSAQMRGLAPDTTFHYRLQGAGSDGTIYVSDDMTFRTPAESAVDGSGGGSGDEGVNLASAAQGATIMEASSSFGSSGAWSPDNAIDADPSTEWSSQGDGDDAFVVVKLVDESEITAVGMWTRTMGTSAEISRFQVVTDSGEVLGPFDVPDAAQLYTFDVSATAGWLRFEVLASSGGNTGAVELAVFGTPIVREPMD